MYKWQKDMLDKLNQFKGKGLVTLTGTGRQMGKSTMNSQAAIERLMDDLGPYKLKLSEYEFGGTYYVVQPVGWMHAGDNFQWDAMVAWVVETFGPTPKDGVWTPEARWYCNNARFYFRNIKDRDWFILRWSA